MMLEMFEKSANITPGLEMNYYDYPNLACGIMNGLSVFITQLCLSGAAIKFDKYLARRYDPGIGHTAVLEKISVVLGVISWISVIVLLIVIIPWRAWTSVCTVSPIFYCRKLVNSKF